MSELTLFQNGSQLPDHLRQNRVSDMTRALMGNDNKRISIEGGSFRMMVGGQEVAVSDDRFMNMIIVRVAPTNSRTYYGGEKYVRGSKAKPVCYSDDCQRPHPNVKNQQHVNCQQCPQNVKGSGDMENSRACRFNRRMAVVLANNINGGIYAMSIPAMSIFGEGEGRRMGLQQYARFLGGHNVDVGQVVTEFRFDTNSSSPKLIFSAVRPLTVEEYEAAKVMYDDPAAINAVTMTVGELDGVKDEEQPAQASAKTVHQAAQSAQTQSKTTANPASSGGFTIEKGVQEPRVVTDGKPQPKDTKDVNEILGNWGGDVDD